MSNEVQISPQLAARLEFWKQIDDNPRKVKAAHRAAMLVAAAGDPTKMDGNSLKSFQTELMEGIAATEARTDVAEVERPTILAPFYEKLTAVEQMLALREPAK